MRIVPYTAAKNVNIFSKNIWSKLLCEYNFATKHIILETKLNNDDELCCSLDTGYDIPNKNELISKAHYVINGDLLLDNNTIIKNDDAIIAGSQLPINMKCLTPNARLFSVFNYNNTNIIPTINDKPKVMSLTQDTYNVMWGFGYSRRFIIEKDGYGFTLTNTLAHRNNINRLHYKNHQESVYWIKGKGKYTFNDGKTEQLMDPQTTNDPIMVVLNDHDPHEFIIDEYDDVICLAVFNPPLKGHEIHDPTSKGSSY